MALVIALETSCRAASIALRVGDRTFEETLDPERSHASDLLPALESLLTAAGAQAAHITRIVVGTGPGSYTGLRVGSALAQGLARGSGADLLGIPSGEALAFGALSPDSEAVHLLDARAGQLTYARYRRTGTDVTVLSHPAILEPADLTPQLLAGATIFAEASALLVAGLEPQDVDGLVEGAVPRAASLLELDSSRTGHGQQPASVSVEPLYLRPYAARIRKR
jgi:tRNA threonylcarbamoyladenosine biosynthesis protein TsaB